MQKKIIRRQPLTHPIDLPTHLHPIIKQIYSNRGVTSASELERELTHLLPFDSLLGIQEAVELLSKTIKNQQRILIVGDFDADGATSSALAVRALKAFGAQHVEYLVPNRFEYGYGLTPEIVEVATNWEPKLIITVDNGISSVAGVKVAKKKGINVLITDHHLPGKELPAADAIVNPNQPNDKFPSKTLAGVGVIFYVLLALRSHLRQLDWFNAQSITEPNMARFLDLVALGTVADVVPLDKNNRILVHQGLQRIRSGKCRPGIKTLLVIAKRCSDKIIAADLGFAVGPRLNAAGRLDDMSLGIECLLADEAAKADELAHLLDNLNQERQTIERDMQNQAFRELTKLNLDNQGASLPIGLCLYDENWHQGVVGLLASRIKDRYHRPVIAFANTETKTGEKELKGSARSIRGLHIRDALDAIATRHPELIAKFGGHAMAAGLSLPSKNFKMFCDAFDEEVRRHLSQDDLRHIVHSDGELTENDFNLQLAEAIRDAGPWGQSFPEPIFDGIFRVIQQRIVGTHHLKLILAIANSTQYIDAIAFNVNTELWPNHRCQLIKIAYRLEVNEYRGIRNPQLFIEHLEPAE